MPAKRPLTFAAALSIIIMVLGIALTRYDRTNWIWLDYTAITLFCLLFAWLASESRPKDETGDGVALRLGKLCKRTLRRFNGGGVAS